MKNRMMIMLVMLLCVFSVGVIAETTSEPAPAEKEEDFFDKMRNVWQELTAGTEDIQAEIAGLFAEGKQVAKETVLKTLETAEKYLRSVYPQWNEEIEKAWNIIKEAARDESTQARTKAAEAYEVIRDWLIKTGGTMSEGTEMVLRWIREWLDLKK